MALPPSLTVGDLWILRKLGRSTKPEFLENARIGGMDKYVTVKEIIKFNTGRFVGFIF